jgi:hypothetical protein
LLRPIIGRAGVDDKPFSDLMPRDVQFLGRTIELMDTTIV